MKLQNIRFVSSNLIMKHPFIRSIIKKEFQSYYVKICLFPLQLKHIYVRRINSEEKT